MKKLLYFLLTGVAFLSVNDVSAFRKLKQKEVSKEGMTPLALPTFEPVEEPKVEELKGKEEEKQPVSPKKPLPKKPLAGRVQDLLLEEVQAQGLSKEEAMQFVQDTIKAWQGALGDWQTAVLAELETVMPEEEAAPEEEDITSIFLMLFGKFTEDTTQAEREEILQQYLDGRKNPLDENDIDSLRLMLDLKKTEE